MNCTRSMAALLGLLLCVVATPPRADEVAEVSQLVKTGQIELATTKLDQFLAAKPKDAQLRFLKGTLLASSKRTAEAIAVYTLLNEDYPELPEPYNNLAVLYASLGQYDKARAALEAAVRANPGYAIAYENLGDVYARLAMQAYAQAQAIDRSSATLPPKITQLRALFTAMPAASGKAPGPKPASDAPPAAGQ